MATPPTHVQSAKNSSTGTGTVTVTISAPTAGNTLLAFAAIQATTTNITGPAALTLIGAISQTGECSGLWKKENVTGSEGTTYVFTAASGTPDIVACVIEVAPAAAGALAVVDKLPTAANNSSGTADTGLSGTLTEVDEFLIAFFGARQRTFSAPTNSFTRLNSLNVVSGNATAASRASLDIYALTVTATTSIGCATTLTSDRWSAHLATLLTQEQVPGAPTIGTATKGNASASVAFSAPASNGGSAITGYTATASPGGATGTGASSPITVSGLTNGTAYTFTVKATNAVGDSAASSASNSATPSTTPQPPTALVGTHGNGQVSVDFTAPVDNGGSAITGYTVTSTPGSFTGTGASSPIVVSGLTNGTSYTFTAHATNANGNSSESTASAAVVPSTTPSAPTIGTATAGDTTASVAFTPGATGGATPTYTATSTPGSITGSGSASPVTVSGLTDGVAYTFTVHATNIDGTSAESAASNSVTPTLTAPSVPTGLVITPGNGQVHAEWVAPASGGAVASYVVGVTPYLSDGTTTTTDNDISDVLVTAPAVLTDLFALKNGQLYKLTVKSRNAAGDSAAVTSAAFYTKAGTPGDSGTGPYTAAEYWYNVRQGK